MYEYIYFSYSFMDNSFLCNGISVSQTKEKNCTEVWNTNVYFSGMECINTIPIRGKKIDMDFYPEFIVISECDKEYILDKKFDDFKFHGSYFTLVFEFKINGKVKQMLLTRKQKKLLYDFFDIY